MNYKLSPFFLYRQSKLKITQQIEESIVFALILPIHTLYIATNQLSIDKQYSNKIDTSIFVLLRMKFKNVWVLRKII